MKIATSILTGAALLAMAQAAQAVPPKPTGKYAFMGFNQCEARFNFSIRNYTTPGAGTDVGVKMISPAQSGTLSAETGYITFTPSTVGASSGNVVLTNRSQAQGGALRINNSRFPWTGGSEADLNGTYSFTDTTFTITIPVQGTFTFAMTHANAGKTFYLVRHEAPDPCLNAITATKQ